MTIHRLDAIKTEFIRDFPWQQPVRCATTANITIATGLNAGDVIDGVTLVAGDPVLIKDQSTGSQNGIIIAGAVPARSEHMCTGLDTLGSVIVVLQGTVNGGKVFKNTNTGPITIDTTALTFAEFGAGAAFATPAIVLGTAAAAGSATTVIRSDGTIAAFDATAPTTSAIGDAAATGSVAKAARRDHLHGREALSTATPLVEAGSGAVGTGVKSSREDHVHPAASVDAPRILLADGHATPFVFTDLLQMDDGSDFMYSDP